MKTHPLNVTYLVIGLVFLATAAFWLLHEAGLVAAADVSWLGPLALILAGGAGLAATVLRGSRRTGGSGTSYEPPAETPYDAPLRPDYTSDIDRRLAEQERSTATRPTPATTTTTAAAGAADETDPTDTPETKDEDR